MPRLSADAIRELAKPGLEIIYESFMGGEDVKATIIECLDKTDRLEVRPHRYKKVTCFVSFVRVISINGIEIG